MSQLCPPQTRHWPRRPYSLLWGRRANSGGREGGGLHTVGTTPSSADGQQRGQSCSSFAIQIMSSQSGNQWCCINLPTANVICILILDPLFDAPHTGAIVLWGHPSLCTPIPCLKSHISQAKPTSRAAFQNSPSLCYQAVCSAVLSQPHKGIRSARQS